MKVFAAPGGELRLSRHPYDHDPTLQAWNAADQLLLEWLSENPLPPAAPIAVCNDAFGALTCALVRAGYRVFHHGDSALSQKAALWNLEENGLSSEAVTFLDSLAPLPADLAVVWLRIPRNLSFLAWQLRLVRESQASLVVGAAMLKELPTSAIDLFSQTIGPATTSLAEKKARLVFARPAETLTLSPSDWPRTWKLDGTGWPVTVHANVFSREGLDGGTRLFLRNFPSLKAPGAQVIDLGCGAGILGLAAALASPQAKVYCVDESFMAVWSARQTFLANGVGKQGVFLAADGLEDFDKASADLVLCNPPFHFQSAQTQEIAWNMFEQALRVLRPGGELWVVANRSLGYHKRLAEAFAKVRTAGLDEKYIVLACEKGSA